MTHCINKTLALSKESDAVLPLKANESYSTNIPCPEGKFPTRPFYNVAAQYVRTLQALFSARCYANKKLFEKEKSGEFFKSEAPHT